jgi:DNA-binding response OmpR family regulator
MSLRYSHNEILWVEDDEADISTYSKYAKGVELKVFEDGEDFLHYMGKISAGEVRIPRVILIDLNLPKVRGQELIKAIRSTHETRLTPVIVLTSSANIDDQFKALEAGANAYIRKPDSLKEIEDTFEGIKKFWIQVAEPQAESNK